MATLIDHLHNTDTPGTAERLFELMVSAEAAATRHRPADLNRYALITTRAAVRAGRRTPSAKQELLLSRVERAAWEDANPQAGTDV